MAAGGGLGARGWGARLHAGPRWRREDGDRMDCGGHQLGARGEDGKYSPVGLPHDRHASRLSLQVKATDISASQVDTAEDVCWFIFVWSKKRGHK